MSRYRGAYPNYGQFGGQSYAGPQSVDEMVLSQYQRMIMNRQPMFDPNALAQQQYMTKGFDLPVIWNPNVGPSWFPAPAFEGLMRSVRKAKDVYESEMENLSVMLNEMEPMNEADRRRREELKAKLKEMYDRHQGIGDPLERHLAKDRAFKEFSSFFRESLFPEYKNYLEQKAWTERMVALGKLKNMTEGFNSGNVATGSEHKYEKLNALSPEEVAKISDRASRQWTRFMVENSDMVYGVNLTALNAAGVFALTLAQDVANLFKNGDLNEMKQVVGRDINKVGVRPIDMYNETRDIIGVMPFAASALKMLTNALQQYGELDEKTTPTDRLHEIMSSCATSDNYIQCLNEASGKAQLGTRMVNIYNNLSALGGKIPSMNDFIVGSHELAATYKGFPPETLEKITSNVIYMAPLFKEIMKSKIEESVIEAEKNYGKDLDIDTDAYAEYMTNMYMQYFNEVNDKVSMGLAHVYDSTLDKQPPRYRPSYPKSKRGDGDIMERSNITLTYTYTPASFVDADTRTAIGFPTGIQVDAKDVDQSKLSKTYGSTYKGSGIMYIHNGIPIVASTREAINKFLEDYLKMEEKDISKIRPSGNINRNQVFQNAGTFVYVSNDGRPSVSKGVVIGYLNDGNGTISLMGYATGDRAIKAFNNKVVGTREYILSRKSVGTALSHMNNVGPSFVNREGGIDVPFYVSSSSIDEFYRRSDNAFIPAVKIELPGSADKGYSRMMLKDMMIPISNLKSIDEDDKMLPYLHNLVTTAIKNAVKTPMEGVEIKLSFGTISIDGIPSYVAAYRFTEPTSNSEQVGAFIVDQAAIKSMISERSPWKWRVIDSKKIKNDKEAYNVVKRLSMPQIMNIIEFNKSLEAIKETTGMSEDDVRELFDIAVEYALLDGEGELSEEDKKRFRSDIRKKLPLVLKDERTERTIELLMSTMNNLSPSIYNTIKTIDKNIEIPDVSLGAHYELARFGSRKRIDEERRRAKERVKEKIRKVSNPLSRLHNYVNYDRIKEYIEESPYQIVRSGFVLSGFGFASSTGLYASNVNLMYADPALTWKYMRKSGYFDEDAIERMRLILEKNGLSGYMPISNNMLMSVTKRGEAANTVYIAKHLFKNESAYRQYVDAANQLFDVIE